MIEFNHQACKAGEGKNEDLSSLINYQACKAGEGKNEDLSSLINHHII
jgi:hypothetical protein